MKVSNLGELTPGKTIGVWLPQGDGDIHVYAFNQTPEGTGVAIGVNPTHGSDLKGSDPCLVIDPEGKARLQYFENGKCEIVDLSMDVVKGNLLGFLLGLKGYAMAKTSS